MGKRFDRPHGPLGSEHILAGSVTGSATAHVKGAWVQIDASAARDVRGFWVGSTTAIGVATTNTSMVIEFGFGAAAAEVGQVEFFVGGLEAFRWIYVPLHIPALTRLSARLQGAVVSDIFTPRVILEFAANPPEWGGFVGGTALGLDLATSAPTTGDLTDNAWDECVASTAAPYRALSLYLGANTAVMSGGSMVVDVGVGAVGSEQLLGSWWTNISSGEVMNEILGPIYIAADIAAGSRLSIRKNSTADASGHLVGWR